MCHRNAFLFLNPLYLRNQIVGEFTNCVNIILQLKVNFLILTQEDDYIFFKLHGNLSKIRLMRTRQNIEGLQ